MSFFLSKTAHAAILFVALVFMFAGTPANAADVACGSCAGASEGEGKCSVFIQQCTDMGGMVDETDACVVAENKCGQNKCPGDMVRQGKDCVMTATGGGTGGAPPVPGTSTQPPAVDPTTFDFKCYEGYGVLSSASKTHCEALPGHMVINNAQYTCYTANFNTCKVFKAGSTSGNSPQTSPTPATGPASCSTKPGTKYQCISCGVTPSQLPCAISAGCNPGTTGACVATGSPSGTVPGNTPPSGTVSGNACTGNMLCNPLKVDSIEQLILTIIDVVLVFLLPVIILYIMYAGYLFVTAQGNPGEISAARKALLTALIGGVIVLGARAILDVVKGTIEAVTGDTSMLDTATPPPTGGSGGAAGGSGGNGGAGGSSGNTKPTIDATFANYAVGSWTGSGVGKVQTTEAMPTQSFNTYYSKACSVCYADFKTLATGVNRCIGKDLPVGAESFESMCTRYKGFSGREPNSLVNYTAGGEQYIKFVCWVNPSVTTDCSAVPRHSYYQ